MSTDLEQRLAHKERELRLLLALDRARDALHDDEDPQGMFDAVARLLRDELAADGCALILVAETSEDVACVAAAGLPVPVAVQLGQEAMALPSGQPQPLADTRWRHTLAVPIILDSFPMGGIALVRDALPFSADETELLQIAESQVDSAVIQAYRVWNLSQRNRELEAIYEIDRLRDQTAGESDLISGFSTMLLSRFAADFCLIALSQSDTGELIIRGVIDRYHLTTVELEMIRHSAGGIAIPQVIPTPAGIENLILMAAPFIVGGVRIGAVVIGRSKAFSVGDHRMLHAMMTQMDSAVVYSRLHQQLNQRNRELETIYHIDRIRDREKDFDFMLQAVLSELCGAVNSEVGYIMLYKMGQQEELELRSFTATGQHIDPSFTHVIEHMSKAALDRGEMVYSNEAQGGVRSIMAVPLILNDRIIGVFGAVNSRRSYGFDYEDRRMLSAVTSQVDTAVFERLEERRMRMLLGRSVDPQVLEYMLQRADSHLLAGERVILSVLFADLRGSTEWAERTEPEELVTILNAFLGRMTDVIFKYGGVLDKFVGDEVIGLFGTPISQTDHAYRAACAALEMQAIHRDLQAAMRVQGRELPPMGVGVSSGEAIAGEFGHPIRSDFTALGRIINLGSRLCQTARGGQILISGITYEMIRNLVEVQPVGQVELKGILHPSAVYELLRLKG